MSYKSSTIRPLRIDHIPEVHLKGIGQVALSWAYLEGGIERLIWVLSQLDQRDGIAFTTHMNMPMRIDVANTLFNSKFPNDQMTTDFKKLSKYIKNTLSPIRNEIVHSRVLYIEDLQTSFRTIYKARGKVVNQPKSIQPAEYDDAMDEIMKVANDVIDILKKLIEAKEATDFPPVP